MLYFQLFQYEIDAKSRDAEDELKIQTQKLQISGQIWYHFVPCNFTKNCHQFFVAIIHFISRKIQVPVRSTELLSSRHLGFACLLSPRVCTPHHFTQPGQHTTSHNTTHCTVLYQSAELSYQLHLSVSSSSSNFFSNSSCSSSLQYSCTYLHLAVCCVATPLFRLPLSR